VAPPHEVNDERDSYLYAKHLLAKGNGYPLWSPEPSLEHQIDGVSVGDVGLITHDGHFDFLLNICRGSVNGRGPPSFQSLDFHEQQDMRKREAFSPGGHVLSRKARRKSEPHGTDVR
jgi:hypothetical protein